MTQLQSVTLGGGCFWCLEAVFQRVEGVEKVVSGYTGGHVDNPAYRQVCNGTTGHAEVVQIHFKPDAIRFNELLDIFWLAHDPTTLNRQGADVGTQYRSAIFYETEDQRQAAEQSKAALDKKGIYPNPAVTQISPLGTLYPAEGYHQDYYNQNSQASYCRLVIHPKLKKLGMT